MASARKKVVIRRFGALPVWGYLPQASFVTGAVIELLLPDGRTTTLPTATIKWIAYVRDFNLDDETDPERLGRRAFPARPRGEGVWLRLGFSDGDQIEGLAAFDLAHLDGLIQDTGILLSPPDGRSNTQKLFIPRAAIASLELLGAVVSPTRRAAAHDRSGPPDSSPQPSLFEE